MMNAIKIHPIQYHCLALILTMTAMLAFSVLRGL
jgi:hypothetical protein